MKIFWIYPLIRWKKTVNNKEGGQPMKKNVEKNPKSIKTDDENQLYPDYNDREKRHAKKRK